jgi:hypothetical protein
MNLDGNLADIAQQARRELQRRTPHQIGGRL